LHQIIPCKKKSAVRPRNDPSSRAREYRTKKNIWKRKSRLNFAPKKKKFVRSLHTCNFEKISFELKYKEKGEIRSNEQAAVVRKAPAM